MRVLYACLALAWLTVPSLPAQGTEPARACRVVKVSDGDSFQCVMHPPLWGPYRQVTVRVSGIDTAETRKPHAKCIKEIRLGKIAKAEMQRRVPKGTTVQVVWTGEHEKYGRVLARVTLPNGKDWASEMIRLGMARLYDGGAKSDWCK
jgi:endonuclease YncB( thermonuclease family)